VNGFYATVPALAAEGEEQSLAFLLKAETVLPLEPSVVASAYMDTATRSSWFTPCYESRLVEDVWPGTMRLSHFAFRTQLPVFPRGYTSLMHCVQHVLPDGREQIIVTDRSVSHPAVPPSTQMIGMEVQPSGLAITPLKLSDGATHSHVTLLAHFHLKGVITAQLLQRMLSSRVLETSCVDFLISFRKHVASLGPPPPLTRAAP